MSLSEINNTMKLMLDALATQSGYMQMINKQLINIQKQNSVLITSLKKLPPISPITMYHVPLNDKDNDLTNDEYETDSCLVSDDDFSDQEEDECFKEKGKKKNTNTVITIPSQTNSCGKEYQINIAYGTCNCPDYEYRHKGNGTYCKHIANVLKVPNHYAITYKQLNHLCKMIKYEE